MALRRCWNFELIKRRVLHDIHVRSLWSGGSIFLLSKIDCHEDDEKSEDDAGGFVEVGIFHCLIILPRHKRKPQIKDLHEKGSIDIS